MKLKLTIFVLLILLALTAVVGLSSSAMAQSGYYIYAPLVQRDTCPGCEPRPTPTPRMWAHWGEQP